jgi:signal transduction histidine kinase
VAVKDAPVSGMARFLSVEEGIIAPVDSAIGIGQLLVWDMKIASADAIPVARSLAAQIGNVLDREEMAALARNAAEAGVRQALARDLHDSVAQFLAGTLFRLEALRRWTREGNDPEPEIDAIKNALRREQGQLRQLISNLRRGEDSDRQTEIADELHDLMTEAGAHWHIETKLVLPDHPLPVSVKISHEIRQLVREGVANAVRHGKCRRVTVSLAEASGQLLLAIGDDGTGFPKDSDIPYPRSISERVDALGGKMHIRTSDAGTELEIALRSGVPE